MVVAVADFSGGVYGEAGLDSPPCVTGSANGSLAGLRGADHVTNEELLELPCDLLVLAALEDQLNERERGARRGAADRGGRQRPDLARGGRRSSPSAGSSCCRTSSRTRAGSPSRTSSGCRISVGSSGTATRSVRGSPRRCTTRSTACGPGRRAEDHAADGRRSSRASTRWRRRSRRAGSTRDGRVRDAMVPEPRMLAVELTRRKPAGARAAGGARRLRLRRRSSWSGSSPGRRSCARSSRPDGTRGRPPLARSPSRRTTRSTPTCRSTRRFAFSRSRTPSASRRGGRPSRRRPLAQRAPAPARRGRPPEPEPGSRHARPVAATWLQPFASSRCKRPAGRRPRSGSGSSAAPHAMPSRMSRSLASSSRGRSARHLRQDHGACDDHRRTLWVERRHFAAHFRAAARRAGRVAYASLPVSQPVAVHAFAVVRVEAEVERGERRHGARDADCRCAWEVATARERSHRGRATVDLVASGRVGGRKRSVSAREPMSRLVWNSRSTRQLGRAAADVEHERPRREAARLEASGRFVVPRQESGVEAVAPLDLTEERLAVLGVAYRARRDEQRALGAERSSSRR